MTKITTFENENDWLEFRKSKITGTKLKDIVTKRGNGTKIGVYQLIADRLATEDDENPMDRGHRLEKEAIEHLSNLTGKKFITDLVIMSREDNPNLAWSPDGYSKDLKSAAEVKCLRSAIHIQTIIENKIPDEYKEQSIQPFIVCDELETLYMTFYDPRIVSRPLHVIEIKREDVEKDITFYKEYEKKTLQFIDSWCEQLAW
jgi:putative phage-type endonuclease